MNGSRIISIRQIHFRRENKDLINIFCSYDSLQKHCQRGLTLKSVCKLISMTIYGYRAQLTVTTSYTKLLRAAAASCTSTQSTKSSAYNTRQSGSEEQWSSVGQCGVVWGSVRYAVEQCGVHGVNCVECCGGALECYGVVWSAVEQCGVVWGGVEPSWVCCWVLWSSVECCGVLWSTVECCGVYWLVRTTLYINQPHVIDNVKNNRLHAAGRSLAHWI